MASGFNTPMNQTQKKLLQADIRYECEDNAYERGKVYYEKGGVTHLTIKSEGTLFVQLNATVKGSASIPYKQNIRIVWRSDFSSAEIEGHCSCPVGYNCKHVAAACLKYQAMIQNPDSVAEADCLRWLDSLNANLAVQADGIQDFIIYLLKPSRSAQTLTVELSVTREKKTGGLNKGRSITLNNLRYGYSYQNYLRSGDEEIIRLLSALEGQTGIPVLSGAAGYLALAKLLSSGRLFWQNSERPPLQLGAKRDLHFDWQQVGNGAYQLTVILAPNTQLVFTDPPQYLDSHTGVIGGLNPDTISAEQLKKLLAAPLIPETIADEFSVRLTIEHPDLCVPPPKKIELTHADNQLPTPQLTLLGTQDNTPHYLHFMVLAFNYGDWTLPVGDGEDKRVIKTPQGLVQIKRSPALEDNAIARLVELGFSKVAAEGKWMFVAPLLSTMDNAAFWRDFLHGRVPELQADGWLVNTDNSFLLQFNTAQNWDAQISESQNDWFEMRFTIEVNGEAQPLLPLIMSVLENYDPENLPDIISVPLGAYQYVNLPSDKLKPFLKVLYELFNSGSLGKDGALTLSRFNAASLADLEAHSYGLFALSGGKELRELGQKLKNFTGIENVALPINLQAELRGYQQQGLNWLQFLREYKFAGILADDMGLGKTIQALSHLLLEKQSGRMTSPCLIIAPTSLMSNWRRESARFTPDLSVLILQGSERKQLFDKINNYDLILTTYPLLPRDEEALLEHHYHYLILDEAQIVKNPLSKAAQVVRRINANHRLCLTGTPMENHLGELWTQFDFLMPGFLGDAANFKKFYRTPIEVHGDSQQRARLSNRVAPFMLRRTKHEVATELPPKTEIIRSVPLHPKQAALYESIRLTMEKKVRDAIAEKGLARSHITILDALLKLRQTCCDPRTLSLIEAQKIKESAKLDLLMEMLPEQLEEGRRILVFSQFTRMIALIETELNARDIGYSKLTGQTRKRDEAIDLFKSGAVNVFLISLKAGGVGLNLTEADTVIIYDPWWNPAAESQAADRAHRIGQDKPVFIYKLITENTVEEKILAMQDRKRALAESIYKDGDKEESLKLTADDLTALFEPF
jgi:superfamily II DNA or RNA helicase